MIEGRIDTEVSCPIDDDQRSFDLILVNVASSADYLDSEERKTPRLSTCDVDRASRLSARSAIDGRTWRTARIATRIALERWVGPDMRRRAFEVEPGGRPHLGPGAVAFSLSHSGRLALIAVARRGTIGADIEQVRPLRMSQARRDRIVSAAYRLSPSWKSEPAAMPEDNQGAVLWAWVRLEAIAKASGLGIARLLTETGVIGDGKANLGQRLSGFEVRDVPVGSPDDAPAADARHDSLSHSVQSAAALKSGPDQPRDRVAYVAAIAAPSLPAVIPVTPFPANAEELARFLEPSG